MSRRGLDIEFVRGRLFQLSITLSEHAPDAPVVFAPNSCDLASVCIAYVGENLDGLPPATLDRMIDRFTVGEGATLIEMIEKVEADREAAKKAHAEAMEEAEADDGED